MLQHFFKLVFRRAERERVRAYGQQHGIPMDGMRSGLERLTTEFLTQVLRSALAQKQSESRGGGAVCRLPHESTLNAATQDVEQPDGNVVRLVPRRLRTEQVLNTSPHDDSDPSPSAA